MSCTLFHTQLCHTPSFTHNFVTHSLSHTTLSHTPSFTQNLVTHTVVVRPPFVTHDFVTHTYTFTLRGRRGPWRHPLSLCLTGVHFPIRHCAGSGGALGGRWSRGDTPALCVAGVGLGDIHLHFAWQACTSRYPPSLCVAWHLATSTFVLHGRQVWRLTTSAFTVGGRCGTHGTGLAPVARFGRRLGAVTPRHFARQAWHLATSTSTLRGRRALPDIHLRFAWQAWRFTNSNFTLLGRCGTFGTGLAPVARLGAVGRAVTPRRGRRWAWRHPPSLCMAGVHFPISTFILRGRCGTYGTWLAPVARLDAAWAPLVAR